MKLDKKLLKSFREPMFVLIGMLLYGMLFLLKLTMPANSVILLAVILGSYRLFIETFEEIRKGHFALDYIAILAVIVSVLTREYFVASVIALMISSGRNLEEYGVSQAKESLTNLVNRIPSVVTLWGNGSAKESTQIGKVVIGQQILIRKGEVIPLDGLLESENAVTDESSLTGEPYMIEKQKGDILRSGTINTGNPIVLKVTREEKDSTYKKIIQMVQSAQHEKAPLVRLADKYSTIFTVITFIIAGFAYLHLHTLEGILAVLVIATPCPLILATPIALLGGVNKAAKKRIIVKKLAGLEVLSRIQVFIFDKTGTITIGRPVLTHIEIIEKNYTEKDILGIADAIERNSLHPIAKAIVDSAKERKVTPLLATEISEEIGKGIKGTINRKSYMVTKLDMQKDAGIAIAVFEGKKHIATLSFTDEIKSDSKAIIRKFSDMGLSLFIFTGDKKKEAERIATLLGEKVTVLSDLTPEGKKDGIEKLQKSGKTVAMLGDGINDAPALALADVGMVFSNEEQTAASEAADIVILGGEFSHAYETLRIAKRTISIAMQSILWGIGLSVLGMLFASYGLIPPLVGAGLQEAIDVAVIVNALRTSK